MYAILGASGNTGSVVARTLLTAGKKVRLLVRDAKKVAELSALGAEVVTGRIDSEADLAKLFAGTSGAYLMLPPDPALTDMPARNRLVTDALASAVAAAKVPHIVLLSSVGAQHEKGTGPIATLHYAEERLGSIPGTRATIIRAAYFMENVSGMLHPMKTQGVLPVLSKSSDYAFPMVAARDIGETAARALLETPAANELIELTGPKDTSFADAARAFSAALGRPITTVNVPYEGIVGALMQAGMSEHVAGLYREMTEGFDSGAIAYDGKGRRVAGKVDIEAFARSVVG